MAAAQRLQLLLARSRPDAPIHTIRAIFVRPAPWTHHAIEVPGLTAR